MKLINNGQCQYTLHITGRNKKGQFTENFEVTGLDLSGYATDSDIKYILNKIDSLGDVIQNTQFKDLMYCLKGLNDNVDVNNIMFQVNFINSNKELMKTITLLNELIKSNVFDLDKIKKIIEMIIIIINTLHNKYNNSLSNLVSKEQKELIEIELSNLLFSFNESVDYQIENFKNTNYRNLINSCRNINNINIYDIIFGIIHLGIVTFTNTSYEKKLNEIKFDFTNNIE
ncbi:hypothetical protein EPJ70_07065 [Brachyspira aalborgi]|uniref:Uncharacterized protein n=1 Tax=Brachyspira aalborgi TaxID=29522 RepID=A0A5C8F7G7_9SPIR|nr:hypothetical protein [Brachyspira aalborgi]TXJ44550.1 hypothetical protein EPJ70_07065 [Brachyspira aalborgi]